MNILVTGGAGFIGSNFLHYFLHTEQGHSVINLDSLTYAGDLKNVAEISKHPRYAFVRGDICDRNLVEGLFKEHSIDSVIHFAAESHVDNSIKGPEEFIRTNIVGTHVLLDAARNFWMEKPHSYRRGFEAARFHHISTDEVYGSLGDTGFFTEDSPYSPHSPYSASKAASDHLVRSYFHTYGLNTVITSCSNNFGPRQHQEKLIPTIIRKALGNEPIPIYGNGKNVRDWLFVDDHCRAIDLVFKNGRKGDTYNIGGRNEWDNLSIAKVICDALDEFVPRRDSHSYKDQISFVQDRPGHDWRYAIDPTKIERELGWRPSSNFRDNLNKTIRWYLTTIHGVKA